MTDENKPLAGKSALVTGASRGIGAAVARRIAQEGANVAVTFNTGKAEADTVVAEITGAGGTAVAIQADFTEAEAAQSAVTAAVEALGGLDIVVNNAGNTYWRPIAAVPLEDLDHVIALDLRGPYLVTQAAAKVLRDGGRIITISSGLTGVTVPGSSLYSGSKAFLEQVTKVIAYELAGRKITVNAVAPGTTATGRWAQMPAEQQEQQIKSFALGRVGQPDDVADVVSFLASEKGGWITGQVIHATGGQH